MSKKRLIADAAELLFGTQGYEQTSTQQLAKEAGVSEALIFKHYGSKEKLLETLIKAGYRRIVDSHRGLVNYDTSQPLAFIHSLLDLPARLVAEEPNFWEMQYRLIDLPLSINEHERFLTPVRLLLVKAFASLGYAEPATETDLLLLLVDAMWKREVVRGPGSTWEICERMKEKYRGN